MSKFTIAIGVLLVALGIAYFVVTGDLHKTALIPTWFGLALILSGVLANTENARRRMLWMHIAVTVGLIGFLFPGIRGGLALAASHADNTVLSAAKTTAIHEELIMAALCLIFVVACIRSFISARRSRTA